ncbi:Enolase-phosphatase E1 [Synechococcus sp. CBW1107]|jgi:enolase-phosphatase E1|uniref:acireductone synthase n=1 Tax=Synechococcus sp. CBW1107 TaxID=2789857 RepID=UPI002AD53FEA|nr:acireductone synthase [Synechococcus sp. CBW1107]CAK6691524.1 Enolase-phosphatase E1 [Synechococcus sp. CBW1107]
MNPPTSTPHTASGADATDRSQAGISHVLLDIEGTTCPVSFVAGTLFPYARAHLEPFLRQHEQDPDLQPLLCALNEAWRHAKGAAQEPLQPQHSAFEPPSLDQLCRFLQSLIDEDRKLTALKDLQGLIWKEGYATGALRAPLFADVAPTLKRWHAAGLQLAVYSSGSVAAQQLLYEHSDAGDLRLLFGGWFDTRIGRKQDPGSYLRIADSLAAPAATILFVSDSLAELDAAHRSGLTVIFSNRPGNPEHDPGFHDQVTSLEQIEVPL